MYWVIDCLCFIGGIVQFIMAFVYGPTLTCIIGIVWIILYPILLQFLTNTIAQFSKPIQYEVSNRSNIVYHSSYNISFCGLQRLHPFDSHKYGNIYNFLVQQNVVNHQDINVPQKIPRKLLLQKIKKIYLLKLCYTIPVCSYIQMPLVFLPAWSLRWRVLDPMLYATQGTILSACIAVKQGWSINLSGGFHHASFQTGGGFCVYPDISLVVHYIRTRLRINKIMIVDLDAHQGNGYERDLLEDEDVYIIDFYNHNIYPGDREAKRAIRRDQHVRATTSDEDYLNLVKSINKDIDFFMPEFVIYNAGTDILQNDPLGRVNISSDGIINRDEYMIKMCTDRKIPIIYLLSGGYQSINARIIADSIKNLLFKFK